jgi:hypothetical protein
LNTEDAELVETQVILIINRISKPLLFCIRTRIRIFEIVVTASLDNGSGSCTEGNQPEKSDC